MRRSLPSVTTLAFLAFLAFVAFLPLSCGGEAVQTTDTSSHDAGPADGATENHDASPDSAPDAPPDAPPDTAHDDGSTTFKCVCKNWTDDAYPAVFISRFVNPDACVLDGCPAGKICCATPCVSPSICKYVTGKSPMEGGCHWVDNHTGYEPKDDCCWDYGYTACVLPEQCAPGGELHHQLYDSEKNDFKACGQP